MEQALQISVTPIQALLAVAFQLWLIVFPVLILRKLNYLTQLIEGQDEDSSEES